PRRGTRPRPHRRADRCHRPAGAAGRRARRTLPRRSAAPLRSRAGHHSRAAAALRRRAGDRPARRRRSRGGIGPRGPRVHARRPHDARGDAVDEESRRAGGDALARPRPRRRARRPSGRSAARRPVRRRLAARDADREPARGTPAVRARVHRVGARAARLAHERGGAGARDRARESVPQDERAGHPARRAWRTRPLMRLRVMLRVLLPVLLAASSAAAQEPPPRDPLDDATVRFGPVGLTPVLNIHDVGRDNNVFNQSANPKSDFTATISPKLDVLVHPGPVLLTLTTTSDYVYFKTHTSERGTNVGSTLRADFT